MGDKIEELLGGYLYRKICNECEIEIFREKFRRKLKQTSVFFGAFFFFEKP